MPKNQRYAGTAVIARNKVPIRNELTSQLTRWKGIRGNMVLVDYLADRLRNRLKGTALFKTLVDTTIVGRFAPLRRNLLYHFRRLALPKEYWSRWCPGNSFQKRFAGFLAPGWIRKSCVQVRLLVKCAARLADELG